MHRRSVVRDMRRFLRDAAVALVVGAILVALAMVINAPPDSDTKPTPAASTP